MKHDDIRDMLSGYIDGEVTAAEKAEIEEHLTTCAECSDALVELRKTIQLVKNIEETEPPAWMTQKIMAKVRAEGSAKKGFFRKLFFPLHIKLPIEAVAALFLAATAYYIYQNIQPVQRLSEGPIEGYEAAKKTPQAGPAKGEPGKAHGSAPRSKEVLQTPGYKALDMKQEYEKSSPPVPLGQAPAPGEQRPTEQRTAAPAEKRKARPFAGLQVQEEARASKAKSMASAGDKMPQGKLIVHVQDPKAADGGLEKAVLQLHGKVIKVESRENRKVYTIRLNADKLKDLIEKLKSGGEVDEKQAPTGNLQGDIEIKIELIAAAKVK